jgi:hypothetical protein
MDGEITRTLVDERRPQGERAVATIQVAVEDMHEEARADTALIATFSDVEAEVTDGILFVMGNERFVGELMFKLYVALQERSPAAVEVFKARLLQRGLSEMVHQAVATVGTRGNGMPS